MVFYLFIYQVGTNLWLSAWTSDSLVNTTLGGATPATLRLAVYGSLGVIQSNWTYSLTHSPKYSLTHSLSGHYQITICSLIFVFLKPPL